MFEFFDVLGFIVLTELGQETIFFTEALVVHPAQHHVTALGEELVHLSPGPLVPGHDHHTLIDIVLLSDCHLFLDLLYDLGDLSPLGILLKHLDILFALLLLVVFVHVLEDSVPGADEECLGGVEQNPASGLDGALRGLESGDEVVEGDAVVLGEVGQHQAQRLQITDQLS